MIIVSEDLRYNVELEVKHAWGLVGMMIRDTKDPTSFSNMEYNLYNVEEATAWVYSHTDDNLVLSINGVKTTEFGEMASRLIKRWLVNFAESAEFYKAAVVRHQKYLNRMEKIKRSAPYNYKQRQSIVSNPRWREYLKKNRKYPV